MNPVQNPPVKEVKAKATAIHISPRKARLVANLIKNMPVGEALEQLRFLTKKAAHAIAKLVNSAVANASHNFQVEQERLFIKSLRVDGGPVYFRYQPRAQGRAMPVRKRTSHLNLILGVAPHPLDKGKRKIGITQEEHFSLKEKPPITAKGEGEKEDLKKTMPAKKSVFSFFRRGKKAEDTSQLPPKQDPKGKHYTSFDRRGNM